MYHWLNIGHQNQAYFLLYKYMITKRQNTNSWNKEKKTLFKRAIYKRNSLSECCQKGNNVRSKIKAIIFSFYRMFRSNDMIEYQAWMLSKFLFDILDLMVKWLLHVQWHKSMQRQNQCKFFFPIINILLIWMCNLLCQRSLSLEVYAWTK